MSFKLMRLEDDSFPFQNAPFSGVSCLFSAGGVCFEGSTTVALYGKCYGLW